ncbi:MAG TPA: DUF948 domain-containing protein, partial [Casimicrobiaceae bacterium]|nr:DUF948 domain-containing protein [Casimicrobiaceae bacterium]
MVLSLREPIAVAAWLVQAAGAGALPDTIVTKQVVLSTGPLGVVTAIANVLVCIAVIVLVAMLVPAALAFRRTTQQASALLDRMGRELSPLVGRANKISETVESISGTVRGDVEELSRTVRYVSERAKLGVEGVEQRVGEWNTLLNIAQRELEEAVVSTAATLQGVQAGVSALGGASSARTRRVRRERDARDHDRDHDEELEHDHRDEARNAERAAPP